MEGLRPGFLEVGVLCRAGARTKSSINMDVVAEAMCAQVV